MSDIIAAIDEATAAVCGWCQKPLRDDGPSLLYCDDRCQEAWDRLQGEKLVGYKEPSDLPAHFSNQYEGHVPEVAPSSDDHVVWQLGLVHFQCRRCDAQWQVTPHGAAVIEEHGCQLCGTHWRDHVRGVFGPAVRAKCWVTYADMQANTCYLVIEGYLRCMSMELMHDTAAFASALRCMDWGVPSRGDDRLCEPATRITTVHVGGPVVWRDSNEPVGEVS